MGGTTRVHCDELSKSATGKGPKSKWCPIEKEGISVPAIDPAMRRWMCPEIPIRLLSSCKGNIINISRVRSKVALTQTVINSETEAKIIWQHSYYICLQLLFIALPFESVIPAKNWALYLFIFVKSHELNGTIRKYPDHHCPVTLVQAEDAFFLRHGCESGKHSYGESSQDLLLLVQMCENKHRSAFLVWKLITHPDVCNEGSGLEEEFWLCPKEL